MLQHSWHPFALRFCSLVAVALATYGARGSTAILVSVPEQKLALIRDGERIAQYKISTSRFGLGDKPRSYSTPLGKLEIADRIGEGLPVGAVLKGRHATGEVLSANAKGRDPIVTRILHLRGLEPCNERAYERDIYIHGTPVEQTLGKPASYGCIRMRSADVVALFEAVGVGTQVQIVDEKVKRVLPSILIATLPAPAVPATEAPLKMVASAKIPANKIEPTAELPPKKLVAVGQTQVVESGDPKSHKMHFASVRELPSLGGIQNLLRDSR